MPNLQVSRIWHRKHTRPRDASGHYLPGWTLWTRPWDQLSRWVYFPNDDEAPMSPQMRERAFALTEQNRRVIRDLVVIIVAVALIALFGGL